MDIKRDVAVQNGLKPGDEVIVIKETGFHEGELQLKTIDNIIVLEWTDEEAARLNLPSREVQYNFTDGSSAGHWDRVRHI